MNKTIIRRILHIFFPTKCPICGGIIGYSDDFCESCRDKLTPFTDSFSIESAASFTAAYVYDDISSKAIILLKNGTCGNSAYALGKALAEKLIADKSFKRADIIIPVPLHKSSRRRRGYNQTEIIAAELSEKLGIPVAGKSVIKHKQTHEQKLLSQSERRTNLDGAFSIKNPEMIKSKRILLIDDVCTTGSTLTELTKLLKENGASEIHCAVCCKTPLSQNN